MGLFLGGVVLHLGGVDLAHHAGIFHHLGNSRCLLGGDVHLLSDLLHGGVAAQVAEQALIHGAVILHGFSQLVAHAALAGLHGHRTGQALADPPVAMSSVVAALVTADGLPQAQAAILDQVQQQHAVAGVFLGQLNDTAQAQIGQPLHDPVVAVGSVGSQSQLVAADGGTRHLFQVQAQGITGFQHSGIQAGLHQLGLPAQADSSLAGAQGLGQFSDVQSHMAVGQILEGLLHRLLALALQQGQEPGSGQGVAIAHLFQSQLPGSGFKHKIIHSGNPPIPGWRPASAACPWPVFRSGGPVPWTRP